MKSENIETDHIRPELQTKHPKLEKEALEILKRRTQSSIGKHARSENEIAKNQPEVERKKKSKVNFKKSENEVNKALKLGEIETFETTINNVNNDVKTMTKYMSSP